MIRTSIIKSASPVWRSQIVALACRGSLPSCNRLLSTSPLLRDALTDKQSHQEATGNPSPKGEFSLPSSPGPPSTYSQTPETKPSLPAHGAGTRDLNKHDAVSTIPPTDVVRGDWVLFHPVYSPDELKAVAVLHRKAQTMGDRVAHGLVKLARSAFDLVSGYKHIEGPPPAGMTVQELRKAGYLLDEKQWLNRILFLESIAGVPGMVAATLRHLTSLRLMRRDSGWIHTCLEEAENERMHLMTFMTLRQPSIFFRAIVLGAQGVFYNLFFLSYLISPRICHRFVGHLEEEAVLTYTRVIAELEAGNIPEWKDLPAPEISINYWRLNPEAKLLDVLYAVRSDETTHRFVNHSLANLNPATDVNPFAFREPDMHVKGRKIEFLRSESEQYVKESHELVQKSQQEQSPSQ